MVRSRFNPWIYPQALNHVPVVEEEKQHGLTHTVTDMQCERAQQWLPVFIAFQSQWASNQQDDWTPKHHWEWPDGFWRNKLVLWGELSFEKQILSCMTWHARKQPCLQQNIWKEAGKKNSAVGCSQWGRLFFLPWNTKDDCPFFHKITREP